VGKVGSGKEMYSEVRLASQMVMLTSEERVQRLFSRKVLGGRSSTRLPGIC